MLLAVQFGYYSGVIAGAFVDYLPNLVSFLVAAGLSLVSFGGLAYAMSTDFELGWQLLTVLLFFLAGLSASIATICSIVTIIKNFGRKVSVLLVAILVTYMKTASAFDNAIKDAFMPEADDSVYLVISGVYVSLGILIGAFTMRKVELGKFLEAISKGADPTGASVYIVVCALYFFCFWLFHEELELKGLSVVCTIFFLVLNFLILGLAVFLIYLKVKGGAKPSLSDMTSKDKEYTLGEMFKMPKYIFLLIATMLVVGTCYSYSEQMVRLAFEAGAIGSIDFAGDMFWLFDALARFGGGCLAYFVYEKVNGYFFMMIYAITNIIGCLFIFIIIVVDLDGAFFTVIPAVVMGLAVGGFWVTVPQVLIDDAGDKNYGMIWGFAILFNFIGIFGFDTLIYFIDLQFLASLLFVLFAITAFVMTILAWKDDEKTGKKK